MEINKWNWQQREWPHFSYDKTQVEPLETEYIKESGVFIGVMKHLSSGDRENLKIEIMCNEAVDTSRIEGEILDRDRVQSSLCKEFGIKENFIHGGTKPSESGIAMMMNDLYSSVHLPLTHETLFKWNDQLLNGRLDVERGRYRTSSEDMQVVSGPIGKRKIHFVAPASGDVPGEMDRFVDWFNRTAPWDQQPLPALTRAAIAHLYFVSIHPFADGNGRIGRALVSKALSQAMDNTPVLNAISSTINANRKLYYKTLDIQSRTNEITPYLMYFCGTILDAQKETIRQVDFIIIKAKFFNTWDKDLNQRQKKVVLRIFREGLKGFDGELSAKNYMSITKSPSTTATRDLKDLVEKGVLTKTGKLKSTRYHLNLSSIK